MDYFDLILVNIIASAPWLVMIVTVIYVNNKSAKGGE